MASTIWILLTFVSIQFSDVSSLSVCRETDNVFIFDSTLIYDASSERSGISVTNYGPKTANVPPITTQFEQTKHQSMQNKRNAVRKLLNAETIYNNISVAIAIDMSHQYIQENDVDLNVFVLIDESTRLSTVCDHKQHDIHLYAVELSIDSESGIELEYIYECNKEMELTDDEKGVMTQLHDIMCPISMNYGANGHSKMNKHTNYIEPNAILHCDLHIEDGNLLPTSSIVIDSNIKNEMSYEIGYIYLSSPDVFRSMPPECVYPSFEIVNISEIIDINQDIDGDGISDTFLRINIQSVEFWRYLESYDVHAHDTAAVRAEGRETEAEYNEIYLRRRTATSKKWKDAAKAHHTSNKDKALEKKEDTLWDLETQRNRITVKYGDSVTFEVNYEFGISVKISFHAVGEGFIDTLKLKFEAELRFLLSDSTLTFNGNIEKKKRLFDKTFGPYVFWMDIGIFPVPVVIWPFIEVDTTANINAELQIMYRPDVSYIRVYAAQLEYKNNRFYISNPKDPVPKKTDFTPAALSNVLQDSTLKVHGDMAFGIALGIKLYDALKLYLEIILTLSVDANSNPTKSIGSVGRCLSLKLEGKMKIELYLKAKVDDNFSNFFGDIAIPGVTYQIYERTLSNPQLCLSDSCSGKIKICHKNPSRAVIYGAIEVNHKKKSWIGLTDEGNFDKTGGCYALDEFQELSHLSWDWLDLANCNTDGLEINSVTWWNYDNCAYETITKFTGGECVTGSGEYFWVDSNHHDNACTVMSLNLHSGKVDQGFKHRKVPNTSICPSHSSSIFYEYKYSLYLLISLVMMNILCFVYWCFSNCMCSVVKGNEKKKRNVYWY